MVERLQKKPAHSRKGAPWTNQSRRLWWILISISSFILALGPARAAEPDDVFALSQRAQEALELFGLREIAEPPLPPSLSRDEKTSQTMRTQVLYLRAIYLLFGNRLDAARVALEEATKFSPNNYDILLTLAKIDAISLREKQALEGCDRLIKQDPDRLDAYELKGRILEARLRIKEAIAVYKEALERWPRCDQLVGKLVDLASRIGDFDLTIEICKRRLEREPRHLPTLRLLGYIYELRARTAKNNEDLYRESAKYYERAVESKLATAEIYRHLGEVYEKLGEREKAKTVFRRGLVADPSDREIRRAFERTISPDGKDEEVLAAYRELAGEYPTSVDILGLHASQLTARQKYREAHEQYERLLSLEPNNVKTLLALGGLDLEMKEPEDAEKHFERAIQVSGNDARVYEAIGDLYFGSHLLDRTVEFFEKALARDPKRAEVYLALAQVHQGTGNTSKTIEVIQRGLGAVAPRSQKLLLILLTSVQHQNKQRSEAVASLRKAYEIDRTDITVFFALVELLLTVEDKQGFDDLVAQGRKTFRAREDEFHEKLALVLMDFHRYPEAIPELEALVKRHRTQWQLYVHLATAYQRLRQSANGERLLAEARDALSSDPKGFHRFAARYYSMRYEHKKAYEALRELLEALPAATDKDAADITGERFTIYGSLFYNLARMKRYDEMAKILERADQELGKVDPAQMRILRARAKGEMKQYDEAVALYREIVREDPENTQLQYELASTLNEAKRNDEAEKVLRKCLEQLPKNPTSAEERDLRASVLNHLGYMFVEQGTNLDEAERLLAEALELQPRAGHIVDSMGWLHYKKGRTQQAIEMLKKALDYSSEDPILYDHLGDAYAKLGDKQKALEYWHQALRLDPDLTEIKAKAVKASK